MRRVKGELVNETNTYTIVSTHRPQIFHQSSSYIQSQGHACGTCPVKARLYILGLTSVVCHILSCFHGNAYDCAVYTRRENPHYSSR